MKTTVTTLLRDFPKVRRAALSGERVIIRCREGDLLLTAAPPPAESLIGSLKGTLRACRDDLDTPTSAATDWNPSL